MAPQPAEREVHMRDESMEKPVRNGGAYDLTLPALGSEEVWSLLPGEENSMKKVVFLFAIAVVLIAVMAAPALAAKPNLVFVTHITSDGAKCPGNSQSQFTIRTTGDATKPQHVIGLTGTMANPGLEEGDYAFALKADAAQQATLTGYFGAKAGWTSAMKTLMGSQIDGTSPFFYLRVTPTGDCSLVDHFRQTVNIYPAILTVDDDYPVGTYDYVGTINGSNGATLTLTITMKIVAK
jgi:hypothetical protein